MSGKIGQVLLSKVVLAFFFHLFIISLFLTGSAASLNLRKKEPSTNFFLNEILKKIRPSECQITFVERQNESFKFTVFRYALKC